MKVKPLIFRRENVYRAALFLMVFVFGLVGLLSRNQKTDSEYALKLENEEQKIVMTLGQYIGQAENLQIHPQSLGLEFSSSQPHTLFVEVEDGTLYLIDSKKNRYALSSKDVALLNLRFEEVQSEYPKKRVAASFSLQPRSSLPATPSRSPLTAVTFDAPLLPVGGSPIDLGISPGQIGNINNTIFFSEDAKVGIGLSPIISPPTERLHIYNGGLRLQNATGNLPVCDLSRRGTIWMTQPGGGVSDRFAVCLRQADGNFRWAEYLGF